MGLSRTPDVVESKQLGQLTPTDTTAASVYSPPANTVGIIDSIVITNTTAVAATYRLFLDDDGSTFDATTAIAFDVTVAANSFDILNDLDWPMANASGNIGFRTGTANALTITILGREIL